MYAFFLSLITQLSSEDVNELQTNFLINNLLELMALEEKKNEKILICESCEKNEEAVTRCKVCCVFLCEFCTQSHRLMKATSQHRLINVKEVKHAGPFALTKPLFCSKHKKKTLKLFCVTCDVPICRDCIIIDHKDDKYVLMEDVIVQQKEAITKRIDKARNKMTALVSKISEIKKDEKSLESNITRVNGEIDQFIDDILKAAERKRKSLKEDVKEKSQAKTSQLQSEKENLSASLDSLTSCVEFAEDVLKKCDDREIVFMKNEIAKNFDQLMEKPKILFQREAMMTSLLLKNKGIKEAITDAAEIGRNMNNMICMSNKFWKFTPYVAPPCYYLKSCK